VLLFAFASPGCHATGAPMDVIFHVNSARVPCVGVAPMNCLQVKRGAEPTGDWQHFYSQIDGFDYEPGYLYRLLVRETRIPESQVPADASSIRYELVDVLEKTRDPRLALHDIWALRAIGGEPVETFDPASRTAPPYIEFNVTRGDYLGHDGCSAIHGEILALDAGQIRLAPPAGVPTVCGDGRLQSRLSAALGRVSQWRRDALELTLSDNEGEALLGFRKVD
jgi:hypothetical protein